MAVMQAIAVLLGPRKRLLVREDDALVEVVQAHGGEKAVTYAGLAVGAGEALFHEGDARARGRARRMPVFFQSASWAAARVYWLSQSLSLGVVMPRSTRTTLCRLARIQA